MEKSNAVKKISHKIFVVQKNYLEAPEFSKHVVTFAKCLAYKISDIPIASQSWLSFLNASMRIRLKLLINFYLSNL